MEASAKGCVTLGTHPDEKSRLHWFGSLSFEDSIDDPGYRRLSGLRQNRVSLVFSFYDTPEYISLILYVYFGRGAFMSSG